MKRSIAVVALFTAVSPLSAAGAAPITHTEAVALQAGIAVELNETAIDAAPGEEIRFESTVRNTGDQAVSGLVAHLSILSSDSDVYVDPEDWSPRRTQYVDDLAPGQDAQLDWQVRAVTTGPMILYVTVSRADTGAVATSGQLLMSVGGQREVNAANVGPLVLGVPAIVLVLLGLAGYRRRRQG